MYAMTLADDVVPAGHPLRRIREMASDGLGPMLPLFVAMASLWPTTPPPDRGLLCTLLMVLHGIPNEARFCDELNANPIFRWFLGISPEEATILDPVLLAQLRSRLLRNGAANDFFGQLMTDATAAGLLSGEHFQPDAPQLARWTDGHKGSAARGE